jgi:hypothetical protein
LYSLLFAALRGAATLRARALKEVWNIAAVIPVEKGTTMGGGGHHHKQQNLPKQHRKLESNGSSLSDLSLEEETNFLGVFSEELLVRGTELLKRTRKGAVWLQYFWFMMCYQIKGTCTDIAVS